MSALVGSKGWCNGRSKSSGGKDAGEEGGQHLEELGLQEIKNVASCLTCTMHSKEGPPDFISVSVRSQTYKDTACSMIFPDQAVHELTIQSNSGSRRSPSACVVDAEKLKAEVVPLSRDHRLQPIQNKKVVLFLGPASMSD